MDPKNTTSADAVDTTEEEKVEVKVEKEDEEEYEIEKWSNKKFETTDEDFQKLLDIFKLFNQENIWSRVNNKNDFTVTRFKFGFVNDIIACKLTDEAYERIMKEKNFSIKIKNIVVKNYADDISWLEINRMDVTIVNTIVSRSKISPKLIFINQKCQVNELIDGETYSQDDDMDQETVRQLARLLANIHSLSNWMPITNHGYAEWMKIMDEANENEFHKMLSEKKIHLKFIEKNPKLKETYYDIFASIDMDADQEYLKNLTIKTQSPLIFSHNDFNRGNLLIRKSDDQIKRIYAIDFDYSNFNYRGQDLGRYFSSYKHQENLFGNEGFPSDDEMDLFLNEYRQEFALKLQESSDRSSVGKKWLMDTKNSLENLRDESKIFCLQAYSVDCMFNLGMYCQNPQKEDFLFHAKNRYEGYLELKEKFTKDGTIPRVLGNKSEETN